MNHLFKLVSILLIAHNIQGLIYYGTIREDAKIGSIVVFNTPIYVRNKEDFPQAEICGYTIYKEKIGFPFKIIVMEPMTGSAKILVSKKLDYEKIKKYTFEISAHDCSTNFISPNHFERESVEIEVLDVNDNRPYFVDGLVEMEVEEGSSILGNRLCLKAMDTDASKEFSNICSFRITTMDVPFSINNFGCIKSMKSLSTGVYLFAVIALDCQGLVSDEATVRINVYPVCKPAWKTLTDRLTFKGVNSRIPIFPSKMVLNACNATCNITGIDLRIKLQKHNNDDGITCSLTPKDIQLRRKLCDVNEEIIDLLPSLPVKDLGEWGIVFGSNTGPIEISRDSFDPHLGKEFTLMMWMRHRNALKDEKTSKQQILCHSDAQETERRHYMLYIEKCELVLHVQPTLATMSKSSVPVEWRFKLSEVCDNEWHHYVVMMRDQQVELYMDGMEIVLSSTNLEIVSDWPFHKKNHIQETRLVAGACWNGKYGHLDEYFYGELAELSVIEGHSEKENAISCLNNCQFYLQFSYYDMQEKDLIVSINHDRSSIEINASNSESLNRVLSNLNLIQPYSNRNAQLTNISTTSHIMCSNGLTLSTIPQAISISQSNSNLISINSSRIITADWKDISTGIKIFKDLTIISESEDISDVFLSECIIKFGSEFDLEKESIIYWETIADELNLKINLNQEGFYIEGDEIDSKNMENFLRHTRYSNNNWKYEENMKNFTLTCLKKDDDYFTNPLVVILVIADNASNHQLRGDAEFMEERQIFVDQSKLVGHQLLPLKHSEAHGIWIAIMLVLLAGIMITIAMFGIFKLRGSSISKKNDDKLELEWDNMEMNITVNPIERQLNFDAASTVTLHEDEGVVEDSFGDEDDDERSYEDYLIKMQRSDLEWDD